MTIETKNAIITGVSLGIEDHGILTADLHLDYGGGGQCFGGLCLYNNLTGPNVAGHWLKRVFEVTGVNDWKGLLGTAIRVQAEHNRIHGIGHIVKDQWFFPESEFKSIRTGT
jgi:hypothetical protein